MTDTEKLSQKIRITEELIRGYIITNRLDRLAHFEIVQEIIGEEEVQSRRFIIHTYPLWQTMVIQLNHVGLVEITIDTILSNPKYGEMQAYNVYAGKIPTKDNFYKKVEYKNFGHELPGDIDDEVDKELIYWLLANAYKIGKDSNINFKPKPEFNPTKTIEL